MLNSCGADSEATQKEVEEKRKVVERAMRSTEPNIRTHEILGYLKTGKYLPDRGIPYPVTLH